MTDQRWTDHERAQLRQRLLDRLDTLRTDIQRELRKLDEEHYADLADSVADSGEQSFADLLVDVDLAEITRDVQEVRAIEGALMRLARGHYGDCLECGEPIESARLHYIPAASLCLRCQERSERFSPAQEHRRL
jgi:DnaK suppressor protein